MGRINKLLLVVICLFSFSATSKHVRTCDELGLPLNLINQPFKYQYNKWLSSHSPSHSANDIIIPFGEEAKLEGKFSYGSLYKDLEEENVEIWLDSCASELLYLDVVNTNGDGRIKYNFTGAADLPPGLYQIWLRVQGDGTTTKFALRILPKQTKLVIFDIDGTLTLSDAELWQYLADESYVPQKKIGAVETTRFLYDAGYEIVYLSGRHYLISEHSRNWLKDNNFAPGAVISSTSLSESWPSNSSVGEFKYKQMKYLQEMDFILQYTYGNAKTDIYAYSKVGMQKSQIFILGKYGRDQNVVAIGDDFTHHLNKLINGESDE